MDPLDLFSEENTPKRRHLTSGYRASSPVEETETIRELRLVEANNELLDRKKELEREIKELEARWNELQMKNSEELEILDKEEDEIIFKLLLSKVDEERPIEDHDDDDRDDRDDLVELRDDKYGAKPLRDWDKRIEFIKRFYQDLEVTDVRSHLSLGYETGVKTLVKTISFEITYPKLISFEVDIKLKKEGASYTVWKLEIIKQSNNKLNTVLLQIQSHFIKTRNINQFLYVINSLHEAIKTRHCLFQDLQFNFEKQKISPLTSSLKFKELEVQYDIIFTSQLENITSVISANDPKWNKVLLDLIQIYGVRPGLERLFEHYQSVMTSYKERNDI